MKNQKAFTLIELLMVVVIIALLFGIIFASMGGARERARINKSLQFSHSIQHTIGAYAVGIWRFETVLPSNITPDESGYGNNGTVVGATLDEGEGVYSNSNALSFDGDDYVEIQNSSSLDISYAVTIEAWIKGVKDSNARTIVSKDTAYYLKKSGNNDISFAIFDNEIERLGNLLIPSTSWTTGRWYHIAGTYNGTVGKIFLDGVEVDSEDYAGDIDVVSSAKLAIGASNPDSPSQFWDGTIDEVRIYNHALSAAQIQQHYVEGLERYGIALK